MGIIVTIVIGFIIGLVARFFMPGKDAMGFIMTTLLGIVGAWLGAWIGSLLGLYRVGEPAGFIMSVIGALIVLYIYKKISTNKKTLA